MYSSPVTVQTRSIESYEPVASNAPSLLQSNEVISRCSESGRCLSSIGGIVGGWANSAGSSGGLGKVHIRAVASFDLLWELRLDQSLSISFAYTWYTYPDASNDGIAGFQAQTKT